MTVLLTLAFVCARQDGRVVSLDAGEGAVVFEGGFVGRLTAIDTNRGAGRVLAQDDRGLAVALLPAGAFTGVLKSVDGKTRAFSTADARKLRYRNALPGAASKIENGRLRIDNATSAPVVAILRPRGGGASPIARIVPPKSTERIAWSGHDRADLILPKDALGTRVRLPRRVGGGGPRFNAGPLAWLGITPRLQWFAGFGLKMDVDELSKSGIDRTGEGTSLRLKYREKDFHAVAVGFAVELGLLRPSLDFFYGVWEGEARLIRDGGTPEGADTKGRLFGIRLGLHWPALLFEVGEVELGLGPEVAFVWVREELEEVEGAPFDLDEKMDEFAGQAGARFHVRLRVGSASLAIEGAIAYTFGDLEGVAAQVSFGVTIPF